MAAKVAQAYAAELAEVPGFVVIPVSQVETAMRIHGLRLEKDEDVRRLAQILEVDAVVVGVVTEYTPYYPPRLTMQVPWFTANPNFHPIPAGYGLPWGTAGEKDIPGPLVFQAELALAKEQLKTQTPPFEKLPSIHRLPPDRAERVRPNHRRAVQASRFKARLRAARTMFARSRMRRRILPRRQTCRRRYRDCARDFDAWRKWSGSSAKLARPAWIHSPAAHGEPPPGVPSDEPVMQHMKAIRAMTPSLPPR